MGAAGGPWIRTLGYAIAAVVALAAGWREAKSDGRPAVWPTFWFLSAAVLGSMAVARALDLDGLLTELGRSEVRSRGWYTDRRGAQAAVVGVIGVVWTVSVAAALWLIPERRRRYLSSAVVMFSLMCFTAVRLVSLHQVDVALYQRDVAGLQLGAIVELVLLAGAIVLSLLALVTAPESAPSDHATTSTRAWWE